MHKITEIQLVADQKIFLYEGGEKYNIYNFK